MLCESTFLEIDIEKWTWMSGESESGKRESYKIMLMSCSFCRQLGHNSVGTVQNTLQDYQPCFHLLPSTSFKEKSHESHSKFGHFLFRFLLFTFVFFHFITSRLLQGWCFKILSMLWEEFINQCFFCKTWKHILFIFQYRYTSWYF